MHPVNMIHQNIVLAFFELELSDVIIQLIKEQNLLLLIETFLQFGALIIHNPAHITCGFRELVDWIHSIGVNVVFCWDIMIV
jgi:hypothetical protein